MPKISIIVPVYKVEKYLRRCLDSIVNQTFTDWECILVDDGSPDNSGNICDEYAEMDGRFRVFHQENAGVSVARNKGLDEAKGEYVNFIDSDDWIDSMLLEKVSNSIKDYEIVFFGNYSCYEDGNIVGHYPCEKSCNNTSETEQAVYHLKLNQEGYEYFGFTWNKMFRLLIIRNHSIRFIEGLRFREDELFTMQYCQHISTLKVVPETLYYYSFCNGLSSTVKGSNEFKEYFTHLYNMVGRWKDKQLRNLDTCRYAFYLFNAACTSKNIFKSIAWAVSAFKIKKHVYSDDFQSIINGVFKRNMFVGIVYILLRRIFGR